MVCKTIKTGSCNLSFIGTCMKNITLTFMFRSGYSCLFLENVKKLIDNLNYYTFFTHCAYLCFVSSTFFISAAGVG